MKRTKTEAVGAPDPNAKDGEGCTPLHLAAEAGDARLVAQLLRRGAKVDVRSNYVSAWTDAYTPLAIAVRKGHGKVARLLANPSAILAEGIASQDRDFLPFVSRQIRENLTDGNWRDGIGRNTY